MDLLAKLLGQKRRYLASFPGGRQVEIRRIRSNAWEVKRPDLGAGIVSTFPTLWRCKQSLRSAGACVHVVDAKKPAHASRNR